MTIVKRSISLINKQMIDVSVHVKHDLPFYYWFKTHRYWNWFMLIFKKFENYTRLIKLLQSSISNYNKLMLFIYKWLCGFSSCFPLLFGNYSVIHGLWFSTGPLHQWPRGSLLCTTLPRCSYVNRQNEIITLGKNHLFDNLVKQ